MGWMIALALLVACDGSLDGSATLERTGVAEQATERDIEGFEADDDPPDERNADADDSPAPGIGGGDGDPCANGPRPEPIPNCRPAPAPGTGDLHADCVARINRFRWECQCLPPLERWTDGEGCTDSNGQYDSVNGAHASFYDIPCGSGARAQNECPGWPSTQHVITGCLQAMWDEGPEDGNPATVNGHYEAMATTQYTRVACGFFTTAQGDVWGVQNFD